MNPEPTHASTTIAYLLPSSSTRILIRKFVKYALCNKLNCLLLQGEALDSQESWVESEIFEQKPGTAKKDDPQSERLLIFKDNTPLLRTRTDSQ